MDTHTKQMNAFKDQTPPKLWQDTDPLEVVGVFKELRCRTTARGLTAYVVETGSTGGIKSMRALRSKSGHIVRCVGFFDGIGDLIELIESLNKRGLL